MSFIDNPNDWNNGELFNCSTVANEPTADCTLTMESLRQFKKDIERQRNNGYFWYIGTPPTRNDLVFSQLNDPYKFELEEEEPLEITKYAIGVNFKDDGTIFDEITQNMKDIYMGNSNKFETIEFDLATGDVIKPRLGSSADDGWKVEPGSMIPLEEPMNDTVTTHNDWVNTLKSGDQIKWKGDGTIVTLLTYNHKTETWYGLGGYYSNSHIEQAFTLHTAVTQKASPILPGSMQPMPTTKSNDWVDSLVVGDKVVMIKNYGTLNQGDVLTLDAIRDEFINPYYFDGLNGKGLVCCAADVRHSCLFYSSGLDKQDTVTTSNNKWGKCPTCSKDGEFINLGYICNEHGSF